MDTLVLNTAYMPIDRVTWQRAICWIFACRVEVVEEYAHRAIRSPSTTLPMPSIVRFPRASPRFVERGVKFNRSNVYLRDQGECQYCGRGVTRSGFTLDHVLPRARGGLTCWTNVVVACLPCNQRKKARTPPEAGMKLRGRPWEPRFLPEWSPAGPWDRDVPDSWKDYMVAFRRGTLRQ